MTKQIDVDKLREQIDFDLQVYQKLEDKKSSVNPSFVARDLKRYLRTIDEAPDLSPIDSKELDEAAVDGADRLLAEAKEYDYALSAKADYWNGAHEGFLAGANWQAQHSPIDLDDEITKYWKDISSIYGAVGKEITRFDFDDVCRYFYELGKNGK